MYLNLIVERRDIEHRADGATKQPRLGCSGVVAVSFQGDRTHKTVVCLSSSGSSGTLPVTS